MYINVKYKTSQKAFNAAAQELQISNDNIYYTMRGTQV